MTMTELCREVNNWFEVARYHGKYTIDGGEIDLSELVENESIKDGQYFRIMGSVFNDGVHQFPTYDLEDEKFQGAVAMMAVPKDFLVLLDDINEWMEKYGEAANKPYQSESFGGYSYSIKGGLADGNSGNSEPYKVIFSSRLSKWRKLR